MPFTGNGNETDEKLVKSDQDALFNESIAELHRKAQEHSGAICQILQQIQGGNALANSPSALPEIPLPLIPEPEKKP